MPSITTTPSRAVSVNRKKNENAEEALRIGAEIKCLQARLQNIRERAEYGSASIDPRKEGMNLVREMKESDGGSWTGLELKNYFNLTPATLHRRPTEHRIIFWRDAQHEFHYPKWQFTDAGALLPGVQEVVQTFQSSDEWRVMRYFLATWHQLDDRRPLDLLRAGEVNKVVAHAKAHGEEHSW